MKLIEPFKRIIGKLDRRQPKHLSKSVLLEETGSTWIIRVTLLFFSLILVLFLYWSIVTHLPEVAVAQGEIIPSSQIRKVQHPLGGVVSKILIEEGMFVEEGQTVIWLNSSNYEAQLAVKEIQKKALEATKDRLKFFVAQINKNINDFDIKNIRLTAYHGEILKSLKDFGKGESAILSSQIEQLKNDLGVLASQEENLIGQKASLEKELSARNLLVLKGEATKVSLLNLRREYEDVANKLSQIPLQCYKLFVGNQKNSLSDISKIDNELAQIDELIINNKENLHNSRIKAPVSGVVHNLEVRSEGEIAPAGKTIFEIVPRGETLIAEVQISPKDIGHITVDQKAALKFTAFDVSSFGSLDGTIVRISPTTFLDKKGGPYYKATLKLSRGYIGNDPNQNLILPGMTLEADIRTGSKTVLRYLLKPLYKSSQQALRER
ncbi:MAG: HlyD family type I secretion periplasmic adaptor subunit [SAR324 cluster bacterium]|nr:HlyD family type I secretion periplasmic adaptor subunit [SAR324 cluster bacterium]